MRKKILLGIITISTLLAVACGKEEAPPDVVVDFSTQQTPTKEPVILRENEVTKETEASTEPGAESAQEQEIIPFADRKQVAYDVEDAYYENGVVKIHFPQINGMENTQLQNKINENIKSKITKLDDDISEYSAYEITYEIATKGTGVLSVVFRGYQNMQYAAHPTNLVKTLNIDMTSGDNLRLKDYADFETVVSGLEQDTGYSLISDTISLEEFSMFLNNGYMTDYAILLLDYDIDFNSSEIFPTGYSYIKDNKVHLFMEAEHAVGDYIELCFEEQLQ